MQLFGTDGVRDRAGEGLLAPDSVCRLTRATARVLGRRELFGEDFPGPHGNRVLIARDTRSSGAEILELVTDGFLQAGYSVGDLGILPTPGAAHLASVSPDCCLAVVISASHNPAEYNGIKLLAPTGAKISPAFESAVSRCYQEMESSSDGRPDPGAIGRYDDVSSRAIEDYVRFLVSKCRQPERLRGKKVLLDTANGAAYQAAPMVFEALGMDVECVGASPDGTNINAGCGALCTEHLAESMRHSEQGCVGFCFDGDADRMIPITASGTILDGDYVLLLAGRQYHRSGRLPRKTVVATVMSNLGLEEALARDGLNLLRTPVGDRHVYRALIEEQHPIGGEQSGHLIFLEDSRTGDGILAAIRLLDVLESDDLDLDAEARIMNRYPQVLRNVKMRERVPIGAVPGVSGAVRRAERQLGDNGRVLLRWSGTEPLVRVMLEGPSATVVEQLCGGICEAIERHVGGVPEEHSEAT